MRGPDLHQGVLVERGNAPVLYRGDRDTAWGECAPCVSCTVAPCRGVWLPGPPGLGCAPCRAAGIYGPGDPWAGSIGDKLAESQGGWCWLRSSQRAGALGSPHPALPPLPPTAAAVQSTEFRSCSRAGALARARQAPSGQLHAALENHQQGREAWDEHESRGGLRAAKKACYFTGA